MKPEMKHLLELTNKFEPDPAQLKVGNAVKFLSGRPFFAIIAERQKYRHLALKYRGGVVSNVQGFVLATNFLLFALSCALTDQAEHYDPHHFWLIAAKDLCIILFVFSLVEEKALISYIEGKLAHTEAASESDKKWLKYALIFLVISPFAAISIAVLFQ